MVFLSGGSSACTVLVSSPLWSWPSGHHAPSYVHLHSVSSISCKDVLDRSFKANASLISPWVPLVRSPYADGFYSRYITYSRYSFRRKPFQPAFSQHEGLSTTSCCPPTRAGVPTAILEGLREHSPVLGNSSLCVGCALLPRSSWHVRNWWGSNQRPSITLRI